MNHFSVRYCKIPPIILWGGPVSSNLPWCVTTLSAAGSTHVLTVMFLFSSLSKPFRHPPLDHLETTLIYHIASLGCCCFHNTPVNQLHCHQLCDHTGQSLNKNHHLGHGHCLYQLHPLTSVGIDFCPPLWTTLNGKFLTSLSTSTVIKHLWCRFQRHCASAIVSTAVCVARGLRSSGLNRTVSGRGGDGGGVEGREPRMVVRSTSGDGGGGLGAIHVPGARPPSAAIGRLQLR